MRLRGSSAGTRGNPDGNINSFCWVRDGSNGLCDTFMRGQRWNKFSGLPFKKLHPEKR